MAIGAVDVDGNSYTCGIYAADAFQSTYSGCYFDEDTLTGNRDAFLAKYSATGDLVWLRDIQCPGFPSVGPLVLDSANAVFYLIGSFQWNCVLDTCTVSSALGGGVFLSKWNLDGHCLWARTIATSGLPWGQDGVIAGGLVLDGNGELFVSLRGDPNGPCLADGQLMEAGTFFGKYNSNGDLLWLKPFTAISGLQKSIEIVTLRYHQGRIYGHGPALINVANDTTVVDTFQIVGRNGRGFALVCLDPANGEADWFRLDGFPKGYSMYHAMDMDTIGHISVAGSYGGTVGIAVFGQDTLSSPTAYAKGFIAKYSPSGALLYVRDFEGSDTHLFNAVDVAPNGTMALTGQFRGEITLGDSTYTSHTDSDLFVAIHGPNGDPRGFMHASGGRGWSIQYLGGDVVVSGSFPTDLHPPLHNPEITLGATTYTTHGWQDIVLARTSLLTGVPSKASTPDRLVIFANPNRGSFRIALPARLRAANALALRVFDSTGRQLHQQQLNLGDPRPMVDLFGVTPGYYMVSLSDGQVSYSGSLVVE